MGFILLMLWYKKKPPVKNYARDIDAAYVAGSREERRLIVAIMNRIISEHDHADSMSALLRQARDEITSRESLENERYKNSGNTDNADSNLQKWQSRGRGAWLERGLGR